MANEKLRITIEAEGGSADATLRELTEQIEDLKREAAETADGLREMDDAAEDLGDSAGAADESFGGMRMSLADVKAGLDMAGQAIGVVKQGLEMTVGAAANWGDEMGDLAAMTGQSVEEVSTMAATFELVGIKGDTLNKILKTLAQDGINLNMRELRELSAQYQKLQDPVQKNKFLFDHFGKSAGDMAEIMGRTTEELDRLTLAAQASGKVISEDAAEAAEKLNVQMAKLQQRAEGFGIAVGNFVIPSVVGLFEGFDQLTAAAQSGEVSWLEYANRLAAVATGHGTAATLTAGLTDKTIELTDETEAQREANRLLGETTQTSTLILGDWTTAQEDADIAAWGLADAMDNENRIAAGLSAGLGELTKQTLFNQAAAGLDSLAALELARSMGLIDEEAYAAGTAVEDLRQKYDTNHDGAITAAEGAAQFAREAANLARELNLIPTNINTTISVTKVGDENFGGWTAPAGSGKPKAGADTQINGMRAAGGPVMGGGAYIVGEQGPELFVPRQSGTVIANGAAGPTYNLNVTTTQSIGRIQDDFALMRAMAGV